MDRHVKEPGADVFRRTGFEREGVLHLFRWSSLYEGSFNIFFLRYCSRPGVAKLLEGITAQAILKNVGGRFAAWQNLSTH